MAFTLGHPLEARIWFVTSQFIVQQPDFDVITSKIIKIIKNRWIFLNIWRRVVQQLNLNFITSKCGNYFLRKILKPLAFFKRKLKSHNLETWKTLSKAFLFFKKKCYPISEAERQASRISKTRLLSSESLTYRYTLLPCLPSLLPASISFIADWKISLWSRISFYLFGS